MYLKPILLFALILHMSCINNPTTEKSKQQNYTAENSQNKFPLQSKHSSSNEIVDIMLTDMNGDTTPISKVLTNKKNHVVSLMASWCGPCRVELNAFQKVADKWSEDLNTDIIALSIEKPSDTHKLIALVKKQGWTMKVYHDKMAYTSRALDVFDIPHTFLVNQDGEITFRTEGFKSNIVSIYESEILKLL